MKYFDSKNIIRRISHLSKNLREQSCCLSLVKPSCDKQLFLMLCKVSCHVFQICSLTTFVRLKICNASCFVKNATTLEKLQIQMKRHLHVKCNYFDNVTLAINKSGRFQHFWEDRKVVQSRLLMFLSYFTIYIRL